jgi:hypothetical protein
MAAPSNGKETAMTLATAPETLAATTLTLHEQIGFELGWDYAHYRLVPPAPYAQEPSALSQGLAAGRAAFGLRTLPASRHVRKWLQLRLHAWLRGRSVELQQVTPQYLRQLEVSHCPITRESLSAATLEASDASIDRVRNDAGYAAGNLAVMSARANHAKGALGFREAQRVADATARDGGRVGGLAAAEWARIAVLASFVEPLPHAQAAAVPMLVLPPNRLRLFNPVQALQALVSRQLLAPGWALRITRLESMLPGKAAKLGLRLFFQALLPRVLEAVGRGADALATRWAIEDAWQHPLVARRWAAFAATLRPDQCEAVVQRAARRGLATLRVESLPPVQATEGWNLDSRGYVPHAVLMQRRRVTAAHAV